MDLYEHAVLEPCGDAVGYRGFCGTGDQVALGIQRVDAW